MDRGTYWSSPRELVPAHWSAPSAVLDIDGGVVRAAVTRWTSACEPDFGAAAFYTESPDGLNWSAPERVSPKANCFALSQGVGLSGNRVLVLYESEPDVTIRRRLP